MHARALVRSAALAVVVSFAWAGIVSADAVRVDRVVIPNNQTPIDLGEVGRGATLTIAVPFELVCAGTSHIDPGQTVRLAPLATAAPTGGEVVSVTPGEVGPISDVWPSDGSECGDPLPAARGGTSSMVTLRAPVTPNVGYVYTVAYSRTVAPAGSDDANAVRGASPSVSFRLAVVADTAPVLTVPPSFTAEGDAMGGWVATYSGVSAVDAEDDPDPVPICDPPAGRTLGVGTHTITCTVVDSGGRTDIGTFDVTVVDSIPPDLSGVSDDVSVTTPDRRGAMVTFADPVATDIVDGGPVTSCSPASGSLFPLGTTTVTCVGRDASGNSRSASFDVTVTFDASQVASAIWLQPIGQPMEQPFVANRGRTIPVKVRLFVDGVERSSGQAALTITSCGGGVALERPLEWHGGRWNDHLDTGSLSDACYRVEAMIDGLTAGSFVLELRGDGPIKSPSKRYRH